MKRPTSWNLLLPVAFVAMCFVLAVASPSAANSTSPAADPTASPVRPEQWAFQPLQRSVPPPLIGATSAPASIHPVDAFVRAALDARGLSPNPPAPPRDLIRRLHFDLIGLPPTPGELDSFERNPSEEHFQRRVDDLLARPQYGERWARHWLDLARYTESTGFEYDRLRENAWPYRDYVIRSFNEDKPYDRFMREQIAGDVLEPVTRDGILATSLLVCGAYDQAGNNQANATQRAITREEELEDLLSVVGQTFLGLTLNCARCHDHKFDPISLTEYYSIKSVFDGVLHGERPVETASEKEAREARIKELKRHIDLADHAAGLIRAEAWRTARDRHWDTPHPPAGGPTAWRQWSFGGVPPHGTLHGGASIADGQLQLPSPGAYFESEPLSQDVREKTLEAWVSLADLDQRGGAAISIENGDGTEFDAIVFGERQSRKWMAGSAGFARTKDLEAAEETTLPGQFVHVAIVYSADSSIAVFRNGEPYGKPYTPSAPLATFKAGQSRVVLGLRHRGGGNPWLTGSIQRAALHDRALTPEEVAESFRAAGLAIPESTVLAALPPSRRAEYDAARSRAETARKELAAVSQPDTVAYAGKRTQPPPTQRLRRGDVTSPDGVVTPGGLSVLRDVPHDFGLAADAPEAQRRVRFAEWLSDPRNPLPARVMANRVWQHHFGQGIVATPSDFGAAGSKPTHPELLDWLAAYLMDSGWSLKALHRLIVSSAVYRQSSAFSEVAAAMDADNQFLWRYPPRRLEAETLRDAMLAVSGRLNPQVGGPSFRPFTTTDFNATFYHPFDKDEPEYNRRTVYRMNVNSGKDPLLDAFDCPDPSVKTPRRATTTTPLQALGLMNGSFTQRQARLLAERARAAAPDDLPSAIEQAYRIALARPPTDAETRRALEAAADRGLASVCWVLLNSTEFLYVR